MRVLPCFSRRPPSASPNGSSLRIKRFHSSLLLVFEASVFFLSLIAFCFCEGGVFLLRLGLGVLSAGRFRLHSVRIPSSPPCVLWCLLGAAWGMLALLFFHVRCLGPLVSKRVWVEQIFFGDDVGHRTVAFCFGAPARQGNRGPVVLAGLGCVDARGAGWRG